VNATVAQLTVRSLLGRRRSLLLMPLPGVLILLAVLIRALAGQNRDIAVGLLGGFGLATVVPLVALIAGTGAIGPEIDEGSIIYLLAKPVSRFAIATTKIAVAVCAIAGFAVVPVLLAALILSGGSDHIAVAYPLGALVAGIAYSAVFVLLAVVTRHAVVIGLFYALVWENLVGNYVPGAQALSIQQWSLAFTEKALGASAPALEVDAALVLGTSVVLLVMVTLGCTWLAGSRLRSLRLTGED